MPKVANLIANTAKIDYSDIGLRVSGFADWREARQYCKGIVALAPHLLEWDEVDQRSPSFHRTGAEHTEWFIVVKEGVRVLKGGDHWALSPIDYPEEVTYVYYCRDGILVVSEVLENPYDDPTISRKGLARTAYSRNI